MTSTYFILVFSGPQVWAKRLSTQVVAAIALRVKQDNGNPTRIAYNFSFLFLQGFRCVLPLFRYETKDTFIKASPVPEYKFQKL